MLTRNLAGSLIVRLQLDSQMMLMKGVFKNNNLISFYTIRKMLSNYGNLCWNNQYTVTIFNVFIGVYVLLSEAKLPG